MEKVDNRDSKCRPVTVPITVTVAVGHRCHRCDPHRTSVAQDAWRLGQAVPKNANGTGGGTRYHLSTLAVARLEVVMRQGIAMSYLDAQGASHLSILVTRPQAHHGHGAGSPSRGGTGYGRWPPLSPIRITPVDSYF